MDLLNENALDIFPEFGRIRAAEVMLEPGDTLYVPRKLVAPTHTSWAHHSYVSSVAAYWLHTVYAVGFSVSSSVVSPSVEEVSTFALINCYYFP